jgi:hypothetical protein
LIAGGVVLFLGGIGLTLGSYRWAESSGQKDFWIFWGMVFAGASTVGVGVKLWIDVLP